MSSSRKTRTIFVASCDQGPYTRTLRKSSQTDPIADKDYSSREIKTSAGKVQTMTKSINDDKNKNIKQSSLRALSAGGHGNVKKIFVAACNTGQGIYPTKREAVSLDDEHKSISPNDNKHLGHGQITQEQKEDKTQPRPDGPSNAHKDNKAVDVLIIEDLDDVSQEFSVSKDNQTQTESNAIHPNHINGFNMPVEKTSQSPNNNLDQKGKSEGEPVSNEAKDNIPGWTPGKELQEKNTEEEQGSELSLSLEEITLSEDTDLPYSRYNGKTKGLSKNNVKPGRPDIKDGKDKTKKKMKKSKKKVRVDEEESYQIAMAGHMPQISMTNAFNATGDIKQTIKKENKREILERIKKGSVIYKLFNKPTKVKKFKIKKEKAEVTQQDEKKVKGIRKSLQRFMGNLRNAFRSCTCTFI